MQVKIKSYNTKKLKDVNSLNSLNISKINSYITPFGHKSSIYMCKSSIYVCKSNLEPYSLKGLKGVILSNIINIIK